LSKRTPVQDRLAEVVGKVEERLRTRIHRLLSSASEAIHLLQDLQLVKLDETSTGAPQSLAVWEELAPVMGQTVASVNRLLEVAEKAFPPSPDDGSIEGLDEAFGPSDAQPVERAEPEGAEAQIASITQAVAQGLRRDVARLGERLKNPHVVADPWNLISDLLEFRGRLRSGIGELIFQVASTTMEAERIDVVPGYAEDLASALLLRQAATNLAFLFRGHARRIATASGDRLPAVVHDAFRDVAAFSRTRALPALRTADKRIFLEARGTLVSLAVEEPIQARPAREAVENMARFFDSLSVISRRENLRVNDRSRLAAVGRHLETAQSVAADPPRARDHLVHAVEAAHSLYGRDGPLDAYLRGQRHFPAEWLSDNEVKAEVARLGALLMGIAQA